MTTRHPLFSRQVFRAVKEATSIRSNGKVYVRCFVRQKDVLMTSEERVRQLWLTSLVRTYGYPPSRLRVEFPVVMGRSKKKADIALMDEDDLSVPYIIIEVKRPTVREGKSQLHSYANATGAPLAMWSNGEQATIWNRKDPNIFVQVPRLPIHTETLDDVRSDEWFFSTLEQKEAERHARSKGNVTSLREMITDMEDEVLANAGVDVFEEVFKLIFTKLYDEALSARDTRRALQFRNTNTASQLSARINALFEEATEKWPVCSIVNKSTWKRGTFRSVLDQWKSGSSSIQT